MSEEYLKELLKRYRQNFDITENYRLGEATYPAYARFFSMGEKYVLKKEAQLWAIRAYEHVLFIMTDRLTCDRVKELYSVMAAHMEPEMVRQGRKYPEKDHMCSYLTFVVISKEEPDKETIKAIKRFRYDKGYLCNFRGHSEGRLACAVMDSRNVYTNYSAREIKELLTDVFDKCSY